MAYLKFRKEKQTKKTKKEENVPNTEVNISKRRRKRKEKENQCTFNKTSKSHFQKEKRKNYHFFDTRKEYPDVPNDIKFQTELLETPKIKHSPNAVKGKQRVPAVKVEKLKQKYQNQFFKIIIIIRLINSSIVH